MNPGTRVPNFQPLPGFPHIHAPACIGLQTPVSCHVPNPNRTLVPKRNPQLCMRLGLTVNGKARNHLHKSMGPRCFSSAGF